ncbi:glycosyltransferase family 4 protein [Salinisphaera sp. P385]|uniref:Glycosyltransferase family 4 protein n=1 Tax=Spectribacter acetivorans TaxID=3075603 RepID=A0ABU3BBM6_9GAMM|nr:glycosyltransferase family 4 protein [Salinisphaera sp. P385]MDT0619872.1 glycosyltransferase family 4 protein [Salinisphaera sp. P385]
MKLLFVIGDISAYGGTERVTTEIAAALAEAGHEVSILSLFGPADPWFDMPDEIRVKSAGLEPAGGSLRRAAAISRSLKSEARSSGADAMILVDTILFAFCVPWAWRSSAKVICWEHFNLTTSHGTRMRDLARLAASRLSDRVVVLTERDAEAWREKYRITDRVQAIWNPIPRFPETGDSSPRQEDSRAIALAVGRLTRQKGFDVLLRAWALIGSAREGWLLRIVGGGEEETALKALAAELGVEDSVVFVGQVRDVASEYRAASLYVMSSRWEGLPMTLLEAQHFGLPSVSTDCPTGPREVLSGGSGRLAVPEDPQALAEGLADVMRDAGKRAAMADAAGENAQRYRPEGIRKEWEAMLRGLDVG